MRIRHQQNGGEDIGSSLLHNSLCLLWFYSVLCTYC